MPPEDDKNKNEDSGLGEMVNYKTPQFISMVERFRPLLDKFITKGGEIEFEADEFEMSASTLRNRLSSVLKFLAVENFPNGLSKYTVNDYARFKARVKLSVVKNKLIVKNKRVVQFMRDDVDDKLKDYTPEQQNMGAKPVETCRDKVLAWLESDVTYLELRGRNQLGGELLTQEDINWVIDTLRSAGDIEYKVGKDFIQAIKGE